MTMKPISLLPKVTSHQHFNGYKFLSLILIYDHALWLTDEFLKWTLHLGRWVRGAHCTNSFTCWAARPRLVSRPDAAGLNLFRCLAEQARAVVVGSVAAAEGGWSSCVHGLQTLQGFSRLTASF